MLNVDGCVPRPLLLTLDLLEVESRIFVKGPQGLVRNGVQVGEASLGEACVLVEDLGIQDCVGELELSDVNAKAYGMELLSVCTTDLGEWREPWTEHRVTY